MQTRHDNRHETIQAAQERPRTVIVSGGQVGDWALKLIRPEDELIGADGGAAFLVRHGLRPQLAIGDFDSVTSEELAQIRLASEQTEACDPIHKNHTDTELAFLRALARQPGEIILFGATGNRLDHTLANLHLLVKAQEAGIPAIIRDHCNEIRLSAGSVTIRREDTTSWEQISLLPLTPEVRGVTLTGFQYPLIEATLTMGESLGISNVLLEAEGTIMHRAGLLLVIQSREENAAAVPADAKPVLQLPATAVRAWRTGESFMSLLWLGLAGGSWALQAATGWSILFPLLATALALATVWLSIVIFPKVRYRRWRYGIYPGYIVLQHGIFIVSRITIPLVRIQHVDTKQGPILRRYKLATVTFSTAAGEHEIPALEETIAEQVRAQIATAAGLIHEEV